jgi:hypothetical protein
MVKERKAMLLTGWESVGPYYSNGYVYIRDSPFKRVKKSDVKVTKAIDNRTYVCYTDYDRIVMSFSGV